MNRHRILLTFAIWLANVALSHAQTSPVFAVASIKPNRTGARNSGFRRAGAGALNATNVTLKTMIGFAYDVRGYQISSGPSWLDSDRYDILAKPDDNTEISDPQERTALLRRRTQALLGDRFQLVLTHTTKELPIFALVTARNGPKLTPSTSAATDLVSNGHQVACHKTSMAFFAKIFLEGELGRHVVDKTGLDGEYDFTMDWSADIDRRRPPEDGAPASLPDGPSLFTAIQEQLGLRLDPQRGPVEILVVDHAGRASEN